MMLEGMVICFLYTPHSIYVRMVASLTWVLFGVSELQTAREKERERARERERERARQRGRESTRERVRKREGLREAEET